MCTQLERLKCFLRHGNVFRDPQLDLDDAGRAKCKLVKAVTEFGGYIGANAEWIPHHAERYGWGRRSRTPLSSWP